MKIEFRDNNLVVFLNKKIIEGVNFFDNSELENYFKGLFLKIDSDYGIDMEGSYNISVFIDEFFGAILEVVKDNPEDKILIINKRGEFASKVTDYINSHSDTDICGNYHNKVDNIPAVDINGNPIFIKSGVEKGKRKSMGYCAQMTLNEKKFNLGKLRCLSLSNSPDKSLNVSFNTIIITSPFCEDIKSYLYRLTHICPISDKIKLFSIFCKNTIEQQKLINKPISETHVIVNKDEIIANNENNFDFLIVD